MKRDKDMRRHRKGCTGWIHSNALHLASWFADKARLLIWLIGALVGLFSVFMPFFSFSICKILFKQGFGGVGSFIVFIVTLLVLIASMAVVLSIEPLQRRASRASVNLLDRAKRAGELEAAIAERSELEEEIPKFSAPRPRSRSL